MKSIARLLSVAALVGTLGFANVSKADMLAGARLGLGIDSLGGGGAVPGAASETRFIGGLFLDAQLAPMFHLQPEVLINGAYAGLTYLDVPVLLKVKFDASPGFKPYIAVGPQLGLKISGASTIASINFALPFGLGMEYEVSPGLALVLDARYVLGLSDINTPSVAGADLKTKYIQITVGAAFAI
jgi:hypothetical protein